MSAVVSVCCDSCTEGSRQLILWLVRPMKRFRRLLWVLVCLSTPSAAVAGSPYTSRGVTADGGVVTAGRGAPRPWAADIVAHAEPQLPAAQRAKGQGGQGLFRVVLDVSTGRVRDVVVKESSGYRAIDENIIGALRQWRLRPGTWKEFDVHIGVYPKKRS